MTKSEAITARKTSDQPISALTAYDYPTAKLLDEAGVDILLVGDSLGMVVLGFPDTTHVTLDMMCHHTSAVARGVTNALVVGDMPIHSYDTPEQALETAKKLVASGADAVKLEGGVKQVEKVKAIVKSGIPVMGHHGMLPQRVIEEGGYKKKGKTEEESQAILEGTLALQEAGCFAIVLESVVPHVAESITRQLHVPTIGIGCNNKEKPHTCDGEIAVISDVVGSFPWFVPPFATVRAHVADEISTAARSYIKSLKQ